MSPLPSWHPLVVHFPIALVLSATALLLAARLLRNESLAATAATVGTWNLCLGAVAALVALATGLGAVLDLDVSAAAHQAISVHVKWAMLTTLLLVLLAVWRGAGTASRSRPSWIFLIVLVGRERRAVLYRLSRRQKRLRVWSGCKKNRRAVHRGSARRCNRRKLSLLRGHRFR